MSTSYEDLCTCVSYSVLRMRTVSDKSCKENQNTHFMFNNFFSKNHVICEIMWKTWWSQTGHR